MSLKRDEVSYSELKSGIKGIALGAEDWFLLVKKNGKWSFSLWNLMPYEALTSWISLNAIEDLRSSPKAKVIRDELKGRWDNANEIVEWILIEIRYRNTDFVSGGGEEQEEKRMSQADKIVSLALDHAELFYDDSKNCYARVTHSEATSILRVRSRDFRIWLSRLLWEDAEKAPSNEAVNSAVNVLESKALFEGKQYKLHNRVAPDPDGNGVWIDMCNDKQQAIHVTGEGWRIVDNPPTLFRRYSHQQPLATPVRGGDLNLFLRFVNLAEDSEDNGLLLIVEIIHFLIPEIPHVILVLYGVQGSAKTTLFKLIGSVIDPSSVEVLSIPRDERELIQQLSHHWCAFYDNVGSLRWWVSDALCRAATGGGFTKRELYTDDDDVVYNYRRCIGLNSINIAAQRPDLLDRCSLIGLKHIPNDKRKTEETLWQEFDRVKGEILGGFLDALSRAIKIYPTIKLRELHRMADFVIWGCAISEALGIDKKKFLAAYDANVELHTEEAARSSPVAEVIVKFMDGKLTWEGSPSELYAKLSEKAKQVNISTRQKAWPKAPNSLIRRINELVPALAQLGYEVVEGREDKTRTIRINTVTTVIAEKVHGNDGKPDDDACDDTQHKPSLEPSLKNNGKTPSGDDNDGIFHTSSGHSGFDLDPSVTEENVLAWLMSTWKGGSEAEFDELLKSQGYNAEQATQLRQKWLNQGLLMQRSGFLVCANGEYEKSHGQLTRGEFDDDRIAKVTRLDPPEDGAECCRCRQRKILCWYVEDFDGSRGHVCQDCGGILLEKLRKRGEVES
jgi:hypothetical protein